MDATDTIYALATPVGESSVGIVRLSGSRSKGILSQIFQGKLNEGHHAYVGELKSSDGSLIDQVLVIWMPMPRSYTGEEMVEIQAHGNPFLLNRIMKLLEEKGARLAEPGEFSKRAYLNGKMDLTQAEAVADLITAKSEKASEQALRQLQGGLSGLISELRRKLIKTLSLIELGFDFSEEDIQTYNKSEFYKEIRQIEKTIQFLLDGFQTGQILKNGLKIAIIGRPNVGKSSLLNALLKEERAIVHSEAGTTRDIVIGERNIKGIKVIFSDTAGIRETENIIEKEGVRRSFVALEEADLTLVVLDNSVDYTVEDEKIVNSLKNKKKIIILNKTDLQAKWDKVGQDIVKISIRKNKGLEELTNKIYDIAIGDKFNFNTNYVLNNVRYKGILDKIIIKIKYLVENKNLSEEILSEEVKSITSLLGEITGEVTTEDVLGEIFSKFCIGK